MKPYRIRLEPRSAWRTPWQADTLFGMLCVAMARSWGADALTNTILAPALGGQPPFVLSDAFPGDLLPVPAALRLRNWPIDAAKAVKKAAWLRPDDFQAAQAGRHIDVERLLPDDACRRSDRLHVTLDRTSDTSGENALHTEEEFVLRRGFPDSKSPADYLTVYARISPGMETLLGTLFEALSLTGFGADTSAGLGQFAAASVLEPADWLDESAPEANAMVSLSTFQPAEDDPTDGCWEMSTKFGKLAPDLGLDKVFKRPMLLLRPGACFLAAPRPYLGHALSYRSFLDNSCCAQLDVLQLRPVHAAFGLTIPYLWR